MSKMEEYISMEQALSYPFANGKYDKENASPDFIRGCESYKEWLESLPVVDIVLCRECKHHNPYCKTQSLDGVIRAVYCETLDMYVPIDWYCGSGEREKGAE